MADVKSGMNLGSTGSTSKSSRLVADVTENYRKMDQVLERIEKRAKSISDSLKGAFPGGSGPSGGGGAAGGSMSFVEGGTVPTGGRSDRGFVQQKQPGFDWKGAAGAMAAAAFTGASKLVTPGDYITNDIAKNRYSFFGTGKPGTDSMAFQGMMNAGTPISNMDATQAIMAGSSMGFMPGLKNYSTISGSAAGISNMVPGVGLEAGMGATAALNQGSSVNKLRMIGIQVRDQNGYMRAVEDIAKDLWNTINRTKTGGSGKITQSDLSYSLQPGMSLDMLLNQYFGGDAVLRQSVISYLYQFASGQATTKEGLGASGAMPGIVSSMSSREAASYKFTDRYTAPGVSGIMGANAVISGLANFMSEPGIFGGIADAGVTTATFLETMGGAGNGAGADIFGGLSDVIKNGKVGGKGVMNAIKGFGGQIASKAVMSSITLAYVGITAAALAAINEGFKNATPETIKPLMKAGYGSKWDADTLGSGGTMGVALPELDSSGIGGSGGKTVKNPIDEPFGGRFRITSQYGIARKYKTLDGRTIEDTHSGIDYGAPGGTPIKSVGSGRVVVNKNEPGGKGNMVIVAHPNGYQSIYGHMQQRSPVNEGTKVNSSTVLGKVGKTGAATGNHLHFGVQDRTGKLYNPNDFIDDKLPPIGGGGSMGVATSDYTNNYGGVTVHINMPANAVINETTLAQEIKRVLTQDARIREAVMS